MKTTPITFPLFCVTTLALSLLPAGADVLVNGDFNTGNIAPWWTYIADTANSSITVESDSAFSLDGSPYLHLVGRNASSDPLIGQDPALAAGSSYQLSLQYRANNWGGAGVGIHYLDAAWNQIGYEWATVYNGNGTDNGWQPFTTPTWVAPAGTAYVEVRLDAWGWSDTFVDNVNFNVVPEPTSGVLMGVGALAWWLARRRH